MSILEKKKKIYSQNGEEGIIMYIFEKLGKLNKGNFIEFYANDGTKDSNVFYLFQRYSWGGIFIERDPNQFVRLKGNFEAFEETITCIQAEIGDSPNNNLDKIIDDSNHENKEFDFVSIDIDGLDYFVFQKMEKYLPKVISIEVNAGHSPSYDQEITKEIAQQNVGQSLLVISKEAEKKGYFPLCYTGNLFLIKNEFKDLFKDDIKTLKEIYIDFLTHLDKTNPNGVQWLFQCFVQKNNGEYFKNPELKEFCQTYTPRTTNGK